MFPPRPGSPSLPRSYAGYLVFTVTVPHGFEDQVRTMVLAMSPSARLTYSLGGTVKYELPTAEVTLSSVFQAVADAKAGGMQVGGWAGGGAAGWWGGWAAG